MGHGGLETPTMSDERPDTIVNLEDVPPDEVRVGEKYQATRRAVGKAAGAIQIGASHMRVPPGKIAWPAHYHAANEEAIFIIEGQGSLRLDDTWHAVGPGDWIALTAGPIAHQLKNAGETDLVYLCVSTQHPTDLCVYPDSGKIGVFGGAAPGGDVSRRFVRGFFRKDDEVPYYDGET